MCFTVERLSGANETEVKQIGTLYSENKSI